MKELSMELIDCLDWILEELIDRLLRLLLKEGRLVIFVLMGVFDDMLYKDFDEFMMKYDTIRMIIME